VTCKRFRVDRGVEGMPVLEEPSVPGETTVEVHSVAFEDFFRAEYPALVALAAAVSRSPHTAEDLAQEAMLRARKHWERISAFDKPGTWVRRVTINLALNGRRGLAREAKTRLAWWERRELDEQPQTLDPDLLDALQTLSTRQRAAVALHYLEGCSTPEIADFLGCSESTARVHLHRGRQALAQYFGATR
jgi:RNA polymerase sigma-70 factor, ECF subfamily